jgi:hypothetical protein
MAFARKSKDTAGHSCSVVRSRFRFHLFFEPKWKGDELAEWWHLKQLIELTSKMCVKQEAKARAAGA